MSSQTFYVTTPIYYINDVPHLGSAYTTVMADVLFRYAKLRGKDARFLTGTDEHGLKIERAAKERGVAPQALADEVSAVFRETWPRLGCGFDDFLRTSEPRHKERVRGLWSKIAANGDIYLGHYEGLYCVHCEAYYTEKELDGGLCPIHKKPAETVKEESYFFRLSKYQERLLRLYDERAKDPDGGFVEPASRLNEVRSFVAGGLEDLSVSRTTFAWGVPVPGDERHVMYVWFDALSNYWTSLQGSEETKRFWPADVHLVGKDILRFHAIYWPAFLMAAGFSDAELPRKVFAHGFLTYGGQKMSKSLRNTIGPVALADAVSEASGRPFGADVVRYVLVRAISFGQDGDFSIDDLLQRYQSELGNTLGNLLNRIFPFGERLPDAAEPGPFEEEILLRHWRDTAKAVSDAFDHTNPTAALNALWSILLKANEYVDKAAPWAVKKQGDAARLGVIVSTLVRVLEGVAVMLWPVMPQVADAMRAQLGLPPVATGIGGDLWPASLPALRAGAALAKGDALFPRLEKGASEVLRARFAAPAPEAPAWSPTAEPKKRAPEQRPEKEAAKEAAKAEAEAAKETISFDAFGKIDLRAGLVLEAAKIPKKDKLLSLLVDLGEPAPRKIVAGLAKAYAPEELIGRRVVVLANLAPRDFGGGLVSHGMLLAAEGEGRLFVASLDERVPPGSTVK